MNDDDFALGLEANLTIAVCRECECAPYLIRRRHALIPAVKRKAAEKNIDPVDLLARFMRGVHRRHEAGLSLGGAA